MSENNDNPSKGEPNDQQPTPPPKPRKRRRWPIVLGALVVLLLMLVILAPALLSTGAGRGIILNIVNKNLNGRAELADLSLSWNGGITATGLKIYDDKNEPVIAVAKLKTQLSLWKTLTGGFSRLDLGRTDVDGLDLTKVHIDENGNLNLAKLAKPSEKKPSSEPLKLSADLHINQMTGNVTKAGLAQTLRIKPSDIALNIKSLNDAIDNNINLAFVVEDAANPSAATPGSISIVGTADVLENDKLDLSKLAIKESIKLVGVNTAALNPFLKGLQIAGIANGQIDANIQGIGNARTVGNIQVTSFTATGEALKGDILKSNISIPIQITRVTENQDLNVLKIDDLKIQTDYGYISVNLNASQESLERIAANKAPGRDGHITLTLHFPDAQKLLNDLPKTLALAEGVKVATAELYTQSDIWLKTDRIITKHHVSIPKVTGTAITKDEAGKAQTRQIALAPIDTTLDASYATGELRDLAIVLQSNFAHLEGGTGKDGTLAKFTLSGNGDLARLREQLGQIWDMGNTKLAGAWTLTADTNGDPSKPDAPIDARLKFNLTNVAVEGGVLPKIVQPWMNLSAGGTLAMLKNAPQSISNGYLTLKSNNETDPTVDLAAKGNLNLKTLESDYFELEHMVVKLDKARDEFGALVKALDYFSNGQITASMKGAYDGKVLAIAPDKPLVVKGTKLALRRPATQNAPAAVVASDKSLDLTFSGDVTLSPDALGADVKTLTAVSGDLFDVHNDKPIKIALARKSGQLSGNGSLVLSADFKQLGDLAQSFAPPAESTDKEPNQLTKGLLKGSLTFARADKPGTAVSANFSADVAMTTPSEKIAEIIPITLSANVPDDLTQPFAATVDIKSKLLSASVTNTMLALMRRGADGVIIVNTPLDMVRGGQVAVTAPNLPALQVLASNFQPKPVVKATAAKPVTGDEKISADPEDAAAQPLPPLRVLDGGLSFNATLAREGPATLLKDAHLKVERLKLARGDGFFETQPAPIDLTLAAAVEPDANTGKPQKISITALDGNLDVGRAKLVSPIVISDLYATTMKATGGIELAGSLDRALRLLEAIQGAKPLSKYAYTGNYTAKQEVATRAGGIGLVGSIDVANFKALDPANPRNITFSEDLLSIRNDLAVDLAASNVAINTFSIDTKSTGALMLALSNGKLNDFLNKRTIENELRAKIKLDWAKVWAIVKPMLDAETVQGLGDFQIAGAMDRDFVVTGSFPAKGFSPKKGREVDLFFGNSIKSLRATGGINIDRLLVKGMNFTKVEFPVTLEKGNLEVRDGTKPKGQGIPQPIACNNGTIDLGGIVADLSYVNPKNPNQITILLTIPPNHQLVRNLGINSVLATTVMGKWVNTAFSGSKNAGGIVNVIAVYCDQLPLGELMKDPKMPGKAKFEFTMSSVELKSDGMGAITGGMAVAMKAFNLAGGGGGFQSFDNMRGAVEKSTVTIAGGHIKHDLNLQTDRLGAWAFTGDLEVADREYNYLNVSVPTSLFPDSAQLQRFFGKQITFPYSGPIEKPEISKDFVAKFTQENFLKNPAGLLENFLKPEDRREKKKTPSGNEPINKPRSSTDDNPINDLANIAGSIIQPSNDKPKDQPKRKR